MIDMGFLTEREHKIMIMLKDGTPVRIIATKLKVSDTSISRSITNIRVKAKEIEEDMQFFMDVGFVKGNFEFIAYNKDPKALMPEKD